MVGQVETATSGFIYYRHARLHELVTQFSSFADAIFKGLVGMTDELQVDVNTHPTLPVTSEPCDILLKITLSFSLPHTPDRKEGDYDGEEGQDHLRQGRLTLHAGSL